MKIIGISVNHISSAALLINGEITDAAAEERFTREKYTRDFPVHVIEYILEKNAITFDDIDAIAIAWNPAINLNMFRKSFSRHYRWMPEILYAIPNQLMKMNKPEVHQYTLQRFSYNTNKQLDIYYVNHHLCHSALTFYLSNFQNAAILSMDGFGEQVCTKWAKSDSNRIKTLQDQYFPHSLGSYYEAITEFLGFKPDGDEWKVMGMAAYGNPETYADKFERLIRLYPDGKYELDLTYFNHFNFDHPRLYSPKLLELFGDHDVRGSSPQEKHFDFAAAAQKFFEIVLFHCLRHLHNITNEKNLCFTGGSAMNCLANGNIYKETPFDNLFIPYAPDDSGNAMGSALYVYHDILGNQYKEKRQRTSFLGPEWNDDRIEKKLQKYNIPYRRSKDIINETVSFIVSGLVVAWYQGKMEFGQRALGNRSILADPRRKDMKEIINSKIKYRESFRPFAPAILKEKAQTYFDIPPEENVAYMEKIFLIKDSRQNEIPAVVHADGTGRLQTVSKEDNPLFYKLISAFERNTGIPVLVNTSFNIKGEPIVNTPEDAIKTFYTSGIDKLILGNFILEKNNI